MTSKTNKITMKSLIYFMNALLIVKAVSAGDTGYSIQPYTPIVSTAEERVLKKASLKTLRKEWTGENFTQSEIKKILDKQLPGAIVDTPSHFTSSGKWTSILPKGNSLSDAEYDVHKNYCTDLLALAYLYSFDQVDPAEKADIKETIFNSIQWYFDEGYAAPPEYHKTFNYLDPQGTTGGLFLLVGTLMYSEFHSERATNPTVESAFQHLRNYCRQFINAAPQMRGPNWSFRYSNCLLYILFTNNINEMDEYIYHWKKALSFNRWEDSSTGVHPDWSMLHHGDMNYWGMYGIGWTDKVILMGELLKDTPWLYSKKDLDFIANCMIEGARWVLYRGACEYSSAPKRGSFLLARTDSVAEQFKELYIRLSTLGGNRLTNKSKLDNLIATFIQAAWTAEGKTQVNQPEWTGHRYFWNSEYQVHRRENYAIYTRRCSQRIRPPEDSSVKGGTLHLNYGTGYTPIVRRGDELRFSRLAWDFQKNPGTTVEQIESTNAGKAASTTRGLNIFSGGVSDGTYGCGAFDMELVTYNTNNSGSYKYKNGAGALKGTFFFNKGMVALGQNVRRVATIDGKKDNILTTVNNVRRLSDVVYSIDGTEQPVVTQDSTLEKEFTITESAYFHHDEIGYVIWPSSNASTKVVLTLGDQQFNSILKEDKDFTKKIKAELGNDALTKGSFNMFQLWIDHGINPDNDTYSYAVLPGCSVEELKEYAENPPVQMINKDGIQAVANGAEGIYYASFKNAGTVRFKNSKTFTADRPLLVMARKESYGKFRFTAANPEHKGMRNEYIPGTELTIGTSYEKPVTLATTNFGESSDVIFNFNTLRGNEGESVKNSVNAPGTLSLKKGYQLVSLNVIPDEADMKILFKDILDECIDFIEDKHKNRLQKINNSWVNEIESWDPTQAYLIKAKKATTIQVPGTRLPIATPLQLTDGINLIPVYSDSVKSPSQVYKKILDTNIIWMRQLDGDHLRKIDSKWINSIDERKAGSGIIIKIKDDCSFTY